VWWEKYFLFYIIGLIVIFWNRFDKVAIFSVDFQFLIGYVVKLSLGDSGCFECCFYLISRDDSMSNVQCRLMVSGSAQLPEPVFQRW